MTRMSLRYRCGMDEFFEMDGPGEEAGRARLKAASEELAGDIRWLASSAQGRRLAWRLIEWTGALSASFSPDAMVAAFNEGRRSVGTELLERMKAHAPERLAEMFCEHIKGNG